VKIGLKHIKKILILIPFILIIISGIVSFSNSSIGSILKLSAVCYMVVYVLLYAKFNAKLLFSFIIFIPFFVFHIYISFNLNAALEEGIRYLFPIIILFYSYSIRKHWRLLIGFVIVFAIVNNFYQIIIYINWLRDVNKQWFYNRVGNTDIYYYNKSLGVIRGVGLIGFFAAYGFLNLIAFFLCKQFYNGKYKLLLLSSFVLGIAMSISFKSIGMFLFLLFLLSKQKSKIIIGLITVSLLFIIAFPAKVKNITEQFSYRVETYVTEGNSARGESYRVMLEEFSEFNFLGKGVGSFGGDASTKYNSPLYEEKNFNWYNTIYLKTTDTYFPHLFVELGIISGLLYLLILFTPLLKLKYKQSILFLLFGIYFSLFFDSLFSFALNSLIYLIFSLALIFPILYYEENIDAR
jgi:hypothetical protein